MIENTIKEILDQWNQVQEDREYCNKALENTGPGESPFSRSKAEEWTARENKLAALLLSEMPDIAPLLRAKT